jgi:hypothetical protein
MLSGDDTSFENFKLCFCFDPSSSFLTQHFLKVVKTSGIFGAKVSNTLLQQTDLKERYQ